MGIYNENDPCGSSSVLVDKMIGNAFDVVKTVACNIDDVKIVADNIASIIAANPNPTPTPCMANPCFDPCCNWHSSRVDGFPNISCVPKMKSNGINLWEEAKGDGVTRDDQAIASVLADANTWGIGRINVGGAKKNYLIGGIPKTTAGSAFNRHLIEVYPGQSLHGNSPSDRATFTQLGGYTKPGGMFGNSWWLTDQPFEGFHVRNIIFDGNSQNQIVPVYAAGTGDGDVWQFQNLVEIHRGQRVSAWDCVFKNGYGDGFGLTSAGDGYVSTDLRSLRNEYTNLMAIGLTFTGRRMWSDSDYFHGDGFWVGGISIEALDFSTMQEIWINSPMADFRDGLSPVEATVLTYASNTPEAQAARIHFRRFMSLSGNYYSAPPNNVFGGQFGRVSVIHPKVRQAGILIGGFERVFVDSPEIDIVYEDTTHHWPPFNTPLSITPAAGGNAITNLTDAVVSNPIIRSDMNSPAIFIAGYERIHIHDGSIIGSRNSAIRAESCGGDISNMNIKDAGFITDRAYWQGNNPGMSDADADYLIGSMSAGITLFGNRGDLTLSNIKALDSRAGTARTMEHTVYANVGAQFSTDILFPKGRNLVGTTVKDAVNSTRIIGDTDGTTMAVNINAPTNLNGGATVGTNLTIQNNSGDATLQLKSANNANQIISMFDGLGLEAQLIHIDGGAFQINLFNAGASVGTPIAFGADGHIIMHSTWQEPLEMIPGTFLWITAGGALRVKVGRPTTDLDGTIVGPTTVTT